MIQIIGPVVRSLGERSGGQNGPGEKNGHKVFHINLLFNSIQQSNQQLWKKQKGT